MFGWISDAEVRIDNMADRIYVIWHDDHESHHLGVNDLSHRCSGSIMNVNSHFCSASGHYETCNHYVA